MRIIVTGAGGFVGRPLVEALAAEHDLIAVDRSVSGLPDHGQRVLEGDFADPALLDAAVAQGCDALIHLATIPGGAAEQDPITAFRINVDGSAALLDRVSALGNRPRVIFASSIAVFGEQMPTIVTDDTPVRPQMVYGAHKAMLEQWIATLTRRGSIRGLSLRLPGIVARPPAPSGMKSAYMSNLFHAGLAHEPFVSPVSPDATMWLMSVERLVRNIVHALDPSVADFVGAHALTLPALRMTMTELVGEVARQTDADSALVTYDPDIVLERGFGRQPPLITEAADRAGFRHDGSLGELVASSLDTVKRTKAP
jgi:nucleoside-diphosphate-sugar epimerase